MNKPTYNNASKMHTIIMTWGIIMLMLIILVSLAGAGPFAYIPNSGSNNVSNIFKPDEAITSYDKAIEITPYDSVAWNNNERALYELNKSSGAMTAYDKGIEINPLNKAVTLDKLNKSDEAMKANEKAIEINPQNNPQNSLAWFNNGLALDN